MTAFCETAAFIKGRRGEELVRDLVTKIVGQACQPYGPARDESEMSDMLWLCRRPLVLFGRGINPGQAFRLEVKTKPARMHYPDTGWDISHHNRYLDEGPNLLALFWDEDAGQVYGGWLPDLLRVRRVEHRGNELIYPWAHGKQVYFHVPTMPVSFRVQVVNDELVVVEDERGNA